MADFNLTDYKKKSDDYFNEIKAQQDQRVQERKQNREKYAVELSDEQYATFNKSIADAQDPDEEAHKIGLAITYANQLGVSIPEAYQNVDNYNESLFGKGKSTSYRNWWTVVCDALSMGHNNVQIGQYGNELRRATKRGDEEGIKVASEAIKAYQADNELKYDNAPRSWVTNVLKNGAQSLPYTGYVAGAAMFGGLIAGPVGTAAAFLSSSELMAGQEYVDMMDAGFTHEIAAPYSLISGGLQGLVEASLGEVMSFAGAGGALLGKNVGGKLTSKAIDKTADAITKTLQTKMHFGPIKKNIVKALVEYVFNLPEEGAEEWLQSILSADVQAVAAGKENKLRAEKRTEEIDGLALEKVAGIITDEVAKELYAAIKEEYPEIEIPETSDIFKEALEDFKGGVEGAIALGFIPAAGRTIGNAMHISKIANYAETMPSEAVFKQEVKKARVDEKGNVYRYSDILNTENEAELNGILSDIWEDKSKKRQETNFDTIKDFVELNGDAEGYVEAEIDEETGEEIVDQVERNEQGELDTETVVTDNEDGTSNIQYRIGTTKKEGKNLYGWIDGTFDKENNKITITKFSMNKNYEGLRQEAFEQFAADNAGVEIDWSPVTKHGKAVKEMLIQNNLNGKNRGLSYYKDVEDLADSNVRRDVAKKIRTKMTNIQSFEVPVAIAFMENLAKDRGMTLNTWFKKTFTEDFIGDEEQGKLAAEAKGDTWEDAAGATDWKVIGNEVKAIIYAGKTADLSTFVHEVTHAWQGEMSRAAAKGDQNAIQLRDKLEAAFNVKDHDWRHSEYTFKNGEVTTADEALAYGIQDFLKSGNVEDKSLADTFKQLAMFIANCINSLKDFIDLSPEIKEAYNSMLSGDDSYLAKAYRDAAKAEREIKQNEKNAVDEQQKQEQKAEEEKAKETEETNFTPEVETQQQEEEAPVENIPSAEEIAAEVEKQNETVMDATTEDVLQNVQDASVQEEIINDVADTVDEAIGDDLLINDNLFNEIVDKLVADETSLSEQQELITDIAEEEQNLLDDEEYDGPIFQKITSKEEVEKLNKEKTVIAYCAMQLVDGGLYPPMAKRVAGKTVDAAYIGDWFKSDEHPEIAFFHTEEHPNKKFYSLEEAGNEHPKMDIHNPTEIAWYFELKKDGKDPSGKSLGTIEARYNPYWHSSLGLLNDQFSSAYKRPNIVIVEIEIPESDLYSAYKADRAKDPVGELHWHEGPVSEKLSGTPDERIVYLSQYKKIRRVLSNAEVAERTADMLKGYDITVPDNTMTPGLLMELEKRGVKIERTNAVKKFNKLLSDMGVSLEDLQNMDIDLDKDLGMQFQRRSKEEIAAEKAAKKQLWDNKVKYAMEAVEAIKDPKEKKRLSDNLKLYEGTSWYKQTIESLLLRQDIEDIVNNRTPKMLSKLNSPSMIEQRKAVQKGIDGIFDYLQDTKIYGHADKAVNAINGTYINCNPTPECAEFCYAANGNYKFPSASVKSEMVAWAIEKDPIRAATLFSKQYKILSEYDAGKAIRLLDKGDMSENWLTFINEVNARGIATQIFSKRPDVLRRVDPNKNVIMLSIDTGNMDIAMLDENKDLPIAFVYSGKPENIEKELAFLEENKERFMKYGGVILPLKEGDDFIGGNSIEKLPEWAKTRTKDHNFLCPVDAGQVTLENYNCLQCNTNGGVGCFFHRVTSIRKNIDDTPLSQRRKETLYETLDRLQDTLNELIRTGTATPEILDEVNRRLDHFGTQIREVNDRRGIEKLFNETNGLSGDNEEELGLQKQQRNTEVDTVRAQYENTDKWMKAPNGEDTNLSENQWLQVRTPSFKNWFGDWENDPENASKVVDKNGEPLVVYHGSEYAGFNAFSNEESYKSKYGKGGRVNEFYFSSDKGTAGSYAGVLDPAEIGTNAPGIYPVFLNIRNPEIDNFGGGEWDGTNADYDYVSLYDKDGNLIDNKIFMDEDAAEEYAEENNIKNYKIGEPHNKDVETVIDNAVTNNRDGVIIEDVYDDGLKTIAADVATDYVVFNPEQIKSATDNIGTFDNTNLDIRYQTAYHGSAAIFDNFNVAKYGLTGEGSMSFGYGNYVTASENIAKDYAKRQARQKYGIDLANDVWDLITYKGISFDTAKKEGLSRYGSYEQYKDKNITRYNYMKSRYEFFNSVNSSDDVWKAKFADDGNRNLYKVEIPDTGYIKWEEEVSTKFANDVKNALFKKLTTEPNEDGEYVYKGVEKDLKQELDSAFNTVMTGENLYNNVSVYLNGEDKASQFLYEIGIPGIDYPAGTVYGNTEKDARNYVIFTDLDAKVLDRLQFQRREEENANAPVLTRPHFSKDNTEEQQDAAWKQLEQNVDTMKSFYTNILEDPAFKGLHVVEEDGEHELFVHENTKQDKDKYKWQISFFDKLGPWSDAHRNSVEEILKELPDYVKFVGVMWDDEKKYDKPYYDDLDKNDYDAAQKILAEYASKRGLPGPWETVITDAADITIPPTKRIENNWRTQEDFWNSGNEYSLQFQTQEELYADAMNFDNWKDFMDSYVNEFDPVALEDPLYHNQVPSDADAQWYQTVWELAHKVIPEESKNITELEEKLDKEGPIPTVMDAMFDTDMATIPGMLEDFLLKIYEIRQIDFGAPDFLNPADEEEARYFDKLQELQDFINTRLSNVTFLTQATHYATTGEITTPTRNRMLSLIEANSREYRALYSEIMENDKYAVDPEDLPRKYLEKKLRKYRLVSPNTDLERKSIDEISRLASELENRELADKITRKKLKMDDELNKLFKLLKGQVDEYQDKYDELEKETTGDYQRIANDEKRKLLKLHEQLQKLKLEVPKHNDKLQRLVDKGLKISGKYKQQVQNYKADYDEIFRKYQDLYTTVEITKEVEAALQRITDKILLKDQLNLKKKEKDIVDNLKKLRIQLVKRTMRRVPFERIDYESARTLIAIQRMLEPNMFGGVNRWIGQDSPVLREVVAYILTDEEYKKDILKYLDNHSKASKAFNDFKTLLLNTKTMQDFYKWTPAQQDAAIRYLPKDNWIKELNLKQLAKEREESIDLDIEMKQKKVAMKDENGNIVEKKDGTPYMATTFELEVAPEIANLVKDAVGEKMYYNIIARPFSEWTLEDMEELAVRVNQIYIEGRDILAAKRALEQQEAARIRERIEKAVKNTGIVINDDDTPEEKQKKQEKIDKILGLNSSLHGTKADKKKENRFNRLLHSYNDATVLRVARILDNYSDGENVNELYRKENECYNAKHRSINARAENIQKLMKENNVTEDLLAKEIIMHDVISNTDFSFTIDELLFINAANADYVDDEVKLAKEGAIPGSLEANDDYAPTSRNAVMFGNMLSSTRDLQKKEEYAEMDKQMASLIDAEDPEVMQLEALNQLDRTPGTTAYKAECKARFTQALAKANEIMQEYPALEKLAAAIAEDYAKQYDRMNEVSVKVLNSPVHRVKCYVPLVRLESNGDTNENQLKEDLLGVSGLGKEYVNKGMTKRRVSIAPLNQKPVQMGLHKTWANSVERTEHFIAYSEYVRELNRVYKSRDAQYTKNFIESRYGKEMMDYINSYINEVANPNANRVRTAGDELIRTLRGKTAPAYLAWKASAIIKQGCTSPWPYMQFVTPAEYLAASWKLTASKGALYDAIREKSVFMKNRVMDPMNDLIKELADSNKGNKISRKLNKINEKGMAGLEWIDWICVAPGWYACYLKKFEEVNGNNNDVYTATKLRLEEENAGVEVATSKWLSAEKIEALALQAMKDDVEKQAVDYADECTRQCQPSNRATDIAPLFKNSSEAMKAYLQFQTSLNVIWNNIRYDSVYAVKNKQFFRLAGCIVGYVAAGIMMNAVMEGWPHGDDDEPEDVLKQFIFYSTTQFTDSVPMIGSALTTANQKVITGKSNYFGTSGTDMTPMVTKFINATTSASKAIQNKDDEEKAKQAWMKAASNFVDGINMNLGLPVSGLKEVGKMAGIGNKQPGLDVDFGSVYGIIDNIIDKED